MRVFVTGGTGAIGRFVVPALVTAGHHVSALARSGEKAAALRRAGAEPVAVSLFEREALTRAFLGHDAVCNLATAIPPTARLLRRAAWEENSRIRTTGSAAVVGAVAEAGVGRLVQESICMIYPDGGGGWIDEDVPPDTYPAALPVLEAESNARRAEAAGEAVVLRFGWFYGPGSVHTEEVLAAARLRVGTVIGSPEGYVSPIHLADAASAVVAALECPSGTYNVVDDEPLTKRAFSDAVAAAVGRRPVVHLPGRAARLLGDRLTSLTRSLRVNNGRFRSATGWTPAYPTAREGWAATLAARAPEQR